MSAPAVQRPSGINVTRKNNVGTLYIFGDAITDGSIRLILRDGETIAQIQQRLNGQWNETSFKFDSSSILLGDDLTLSAGAGFLETTSRSAPAGHQRALLPHTEFDEEGTQNTHAPALNALHEEIIYANPTSNRIGTTLGDTFSAVGPLMLDSATWLVGTGAPPVSVNLSFYTGTDNSGILFYERNYSPDIFIPDQPLTIDFKDDFGFDEAGDYYYEFKTPPGSGDWNLKQNINDNLVLSFQAHNLVELDIVTENMVLDNDYDMVWTEESQGLELVNLSPF